MESAVFREPCSGPIWIFRDPVFPSMNHPLIMVFVKIASHGTWTHTKLIAYYPCFLLIHSRLLAKVLLFFSRETQSYLFSPLASPAKKARPFGGLLPQGHRRGGLQRGGHGCSGALGDEGRLRAAALRMLRAEQSGFWIGVGPGPERNHFLISWT